MIVPLHVAAKYGHVHMVTLLVERGSKVDVPNKVSQAGQLFLLFASLSLGN